MKLQELQEQINRIQSMMGLLNENTEGKDEFIQKILNKYPETEKFISFIENFIDNSNCKKIETTKFKYPAMGLALHNGVVFNNIIFTLKLPMFLFVVFHELTHQYQYKKYGNEKMYEFYLDEIDVNEAAKSMKQIEIVADDLASRKIRELIKLGFIPKETSEGTMTFYKNVSVNHFTQLISQTKNKLKEKNITDFDGISEYFYNMIKANV